MIALDEKALICDFAETYAIYNYRSLPVSLVATLSSGLGINSRIRRKMRDSDYNLEVELIAILIDQINILGWSLGGAKADKPASVYKMLRNNIESDKAKAFETFNTAEDYEKAMAKIKERKAE